MIQAGKLRNQIELQSAVWIKGETGSREQSWATYATVWAGFRTLSGGERLASEQVGATLSHEVTIRCRSDVLPQHRILFGTRTFDIKDVRNVDEGGREMRIRCTEVLG